MKKKIISALVILLIMGAFIATNLITYASKTTSPLYVNLTKTDSNGVGYGIGDPTNAGKYIWNITTHDSKTGPVSANQRNLYCVNADYGKTWFDDEKQDEILGYELYYDIQTERQTLLDNVQNDADNMLNNLLNPEGTQYRELLWLFDNAYISGEDETVDQYLEKFGILKDETLNQYYNKATNDLYGADPLTEADIIALQKMAIWYFTNNAEYNFTAANETTWLTVSENNEPYTQNSAYTQLITLDRDRNNMAMDLYRNLINSAETGAEQYTDENGYKLDTAPVSINGRNENTQDALTVEMKRNGANYLIGPIVIEKNNDLLDDIKITVKDQKDNSLTKNTDYTYTDNNGNELKNITSDKDLVGLSGGFYISVPRSKVESLNIKVTADYKTTLKQLWLDGDEDGEGKITLNSEQPLVEITQNPQTLEVELKSKPEEFDLALRKYIVALYDKDGNEKTIPNARDLNRISDVPQLQTGTTADYLHRKDPVVVEDGDIVTYRIIIYNEGNKAGYASKIVDQLPEGITRVPGNNTVTSSKGNTYILSSDALTISKNQIVLEMDAENTTVTSLQPYTKTTGLDYDTIDIQCKVTPNPNIEQQIVLTNVAWIAEMYEYDEEQQKYVLSVADRDSSTETEKSPNVDKTNMSDWRGSTTVEDLSRTDFFFEGQEDDDDFEKLVYTPPEKIFDLALFKHIAAVSKNQTIEEGEYITDTKRSDGIYLRAPKATGVDSVTGEIIYEYETDGYSKEHKEPLVVEPGDYVLYTIRVYNEGEKDGYASEIQDKLPEGLEFVETDSEYNGKWSYNPETRIATTTWYAKGGNAADELNPGTNLLKAFNRVGEINDENPDYIDAQILCRVSEQAESGKELINYSQISKHTDKDGNDDIEDKDSTPGEWIDNDEHKDDDQDIEKIIVHRFDLSLRKFITAINGTELKDGEGKYTREPVVDVTPLKERQTPHTAIYTHTKKPVLVQVGDKVVYTIRVYNEGNVAGCASEVKDNLPPYLKFVEDSEINNTNEWTISDDGRVVTTKKLANTELKAFDEVNGTKLDYADLQIECIVADNVPIDKNQTNIAEISKYKYDETEVENDIDSIADNMKTLKPSDEELPTYKDEEMDKTYIPGQEDDDDFEKVYVKEFDLALLKFVSKVIVIEDGKETITETGYNGHENPEPVVKVELHKKKLDKVTVKFGYGITITNEGDIPGYATEITDYVPEGLRFDATDNPEWTDEGNNVISTKQLENKLLQPGESTTVEVILTWINGAENLALKTNTAEISEDKNDYDVPDRDSTPDNKKDGEDDIDIAKVILAISTGRSKTYFSLTLGLLAVIGIGIFLIKKYVI